MVRIDHKSFKYYYQNEYPHHTSSGVVEAKIRLIYIKNF